MGGFGGSDTPQGIGAVPGVTLLSNTALVSNNSATVLGNFVLPDGKTPLALISIEEDVILQIFWGFPPVSIGTAVFWFEKSNVADTYALVMQQREGSSRTFRFQVLEIEP